MLYVFLFVIFQSFSRGIKSHWTILAEGVEVLCWEGAGLMTTGLAWPRHRTRSGWRELGCGKYECQWWRRLPSQCHQPRGERNAKPQIPYQIECLGCVSGSDVADDFASAPCLG